MQYKEDENIFDNRVAQFERDQKKISVEEAPALKKTVKKAGSVAYSGNPYMQARQKVLEGYPEWRRIEVATMEKTGDVNNRFYADFVQSVVTLGDEIDGR